MSAQQLMLEAAQRRRDELEGEIAAREADIDKSKLEEEGWRKEAQAALDAAAECERQRLRVQIETLHQEGLAIDALCGVSRRTLPVPKAETSSPVLEAPSTLELPPVPRPHDAWGALPPINVVLRETAGQPPQRHDAYSESFCEAKVMGGVERPVDGFYDEPLRSTIPEESINAAARRMLDDRPGRFLTPGQAAEYMLQAHDEWRSDITLRRLTKMVEKLYENWAKSGDVRERHLEKGRGERAYQAKAPVPRRFGSVMSEPMPHQERGKKGAAARWAGVSPEERSRQARDAANKGWAKRKAEKTI